MSRAPEPDDNGHAGPHRGALVGLIIILALAIIAVVLVRALRRESNLEDCLMAGRRNCFPIETPARQ